MERLWRILRATTVEPMLGWFIIASAGSMIAVQNLCLIKACRVNLAFPDHVCRALEERRTENYTQEETEVHKLVAYMEVWVTFIAGLIPAVLIVFFGSWSDRHRRRKPFMLLPIFGDTLTAIGLIVCTYFFYEVPMEVTGLVMVIFPALCGGWITMFMAVFSYIGDITTKEERTLRIGVVNVFSSITVPVGTALSGVLYRELGFYGIFSLAAALYTISFLHGYFGIREEVQRSAQVCNFSDFLDISHIKETFALVLEDDGTYRKHRAILLMLVVMVVVGPLYGEMTVMYLFTRQRFNWNEVDYSMFATYSMTVYLVGTSISVGLFSYLLKMDDCIIGIISCISKICGGFVFALSTTSWMFYLAPLVDMVNGTSLIATRSIASKLVSSEELGKMNALLSLSEAITPVIYSPLYSFIFAQTMSVMPGTFFLIGGALTFPAILIFLWIYIKYKDLPVNQSSATNQMLANNHKCHIEDAVEPEEQNRML